jgi:hypothetical protein
MKKIISSFVLILLLILSCGKEDSLTKTDLLTQSPWILSASVYSPPLPTEQGSLVNKYAVLPEYIRDDLFYYYPSGTYVNAEGATKYSPYDPDVWELGVWTFNEDESKLYKGIIDYIYEFEILELNGSDLQLRYYFSDSLDVYSLTESFKHP